MPTARHVRVTLCAAAAAALLLAVAAPSDGQTLDELMPSSTTTTGSTTTTTSVPADTTTTTTATTTSSTTVPGDTDEPSDPGPEPTSTTTPGGGDGGDGGEGGDGGDGGEPSDGGPRTVPPEAQRIIDAVDRSAPNNTQELYDAVQELVGLGLSEQEAIRVGFGRFPVGGVGRYSHDWLYPRWGPGFRFHHGTDIMAAFGTPLRAVVDGTVTTNNSALGGLSVKVHTDDGTYFYYAHLSSLVDGFENGMTVETGDVVGYVGDSGNAEGTPHLHFAVYPQGGAATDPKPILDGFLDDALEQLPAVIDDVRARQADGTQVESSSGRTPRSLLATSLLRPLADRTAAGIVPTEVLYRTSGNPAGGGLAVAEREAETMAAAVNWDSMQQRGAAEDMVLEAAATLIDTTLGPIGHLGPGDLAAPEGD